MAASSKNPQTTLTSLIKVDTTHLLKQFPHHEPRIKALLAQRFAPPTETQPSQQHFKPAVPQEEVASIMEKTHHLSLLPGLSFDTETELYLQQQLEDVLGFSIHGSLNGHKLPFTKGLVESLPHLRNSPTIDSSDLDTVPEAGVQASRPLFGWHLQYSDDQISSGSATEYWVSLPLRQWLSSTTSLNDLKHWLHRRKVILINPSEALFAIVEVLDEYLPLSNKFQLGASPAVVRKGLFWSPQNLGKAMVFFLADSSSLPEPGVYSLY